MNAFRSRSNRSGGGYFIEFLIIIAGIMVSFLLNEWREDRSLEEKKITLLKEIQTDLKKDSAVLTYSMGFYKKMLQSHDSLLLNRNKKFNEDSLDIYLDYVCSYYPFQPAEKTYLKIHNNNNLVIEKEDSLFEDFLNLHNFLYANYKEWSFIEKNFVLNKMLPYLDENASFHYPPPENKLFDGEVFYELKDQSTFMNYIKSGRLYKFAMIGISEACMAQLNQLNQEISTHLREIENQE